MRTYTQLTREERYQIYALKQAGHQQSEIAKMLDRHKSTISRELRRNRGLRGYRPKQAWPVAPTRQIGSPSGSGTPDGQDTPSFQQSHMAAG